MAAQIKGFHSAVSGVGAVFDDIYLVEGSRTAFGKMTGALSTMSPTDLGIIASKGALSVAGVLGADVDQTVVANIGQSTADSLFLARHVGLYSGVPLESPALLAQRICGSGIEVISQACQQIGTGQARVVLCCGTEVMSRFPLVSYSARQGFALGRPEFVDFLWEALNDTAAVSMGNTADNLAKKYNLSKTEVDTFAERSQSLYAKAFEEGFFKDEIVPVPVQGVFEVEGIKPRKYKLRATDEFLNDEHPRRTTVEKLGQLPPVFTKEGPTTAGSASGIVDGAASVVVASGDFVRAHGIRVLGKIRVVVSAGVEPAIMGIGPAPSIRSALNAINLSLKDIDYFEINEAFGAQCLAVARELDLNLEKLNVHGGAIAIGHPLAATGCRLALTVLKTLKKTKKTFGCASACIGGGQGIAMILEAVS